ncbi:hypothetical protein BDW59DRAFT_164536 [Aspergillus cavernicola]|uniref:AA1-like domain-containing protein n=1 Tax=Aspergillus cavernicola TaxID=176166 RepID=A0ABR4HZP4_9EURO
MKTTFAAIALSLFSIAIAAPAPVTTPQPNPYPVSVGNISLKHLIESDTYDFTFYATTRSLEGEALETVYCHTAWSNGGPYLGANAPEACASVYSFFFEEGAADIQSYQLSVIGPEGKATGTIATGPKYQCGPYQGTIGNIDIDCRTTNGGEFYLRAD